jgi:hypothetical protein
MHSIDYLGLDYTLARSASEGRKRFTLVYASGWYFAPCVKKTVLRSEYPKTRAEYIVNLTAIATAILQSPGLPPAP